MSFLRVGQTFDQLVERVSELESENRGLIDDLRKVRQELSAAEGQRDTARADLSYHQIHFSVRTGW